ncbi:hypothetical protein M8J74_20680 [Streptomyces panaciradicis]|nr:hypothetical protein [Streptomyces panaciradicis]
MASPHTPAPRGAKTATSSTPRISSVTTTAARAATTAVAAPVAHSRPAATPVACPSW